MLNAFAVEVKFGKVVFGGGEILVGGLLIPLGRFGVILFDAAAFSVKECEVFLAGSGTLLGGLAKPRGGLFEVLTEHCGWFRQAS